MESKTLSEVAGELGVPGNTIKTWLHQLEGIPAEKDGAGRWRFPPEASEILRQIQALRLDGRSLNTVRRRLNEDSSTDERSQAGDPQEQGDRPDERPTSDAVTVKLLEMLEAERTRTAEAEARAAELLEQRAGIEAACAMHQERAANLAHEVQRLSGQVLLLAAPKPAPWWKIW